MTDAPRGDAVSDNACKTPLIDLLKSVPADARATYEHHPTAHSNIPYGRLCNEAAAEIERLRAENAELLALIAAFVDELTGRLPCGDTEQI